MSGMNTGEYKVGERKLQIHMAEVEVVLLWLSGLPETQVDHMRDSFKKYLREQTPEEEWTRCIWKAVYFRW